MITLNQRGEGPGGTISSTGSGRTNLALRMASAAVLTPVAIAGIYVGGWPFLVLCGFAAGAILWEWTVLASGWSDPRILVPGFGGLFGAAVLTGTNQAGGAAVVIAICAVLAGGAAAAARRSSVRSTSSVAVWAAAGVLYAGAAFLGPALLRRDPEFGFTAVLFVALIVWITDISAYFIGSNIGGPLLWSRISPKKTWSGAVGGLAGGVAAGTLVFYANGLSKLVVAGIIALMLSVVAQVGDLFESAVKRRFGAKDASRLIPGHGGMMDRLDGFLVAALVALLIGILRYGTDAPARGLLVW